MTDRIDVSQTAQPHRSNSNTNFFLYPACDKVTAMVVRISLKSIAVVGQMVRLHRKQAGLSRIALADIAGVARRLSLTSKWANKRCGSTP
jgi:hypothetical protein